MDERLAAYGWLTNTGIKFVIVVDMAGRPPAPEDDKKKPPPIVGLRDSDLKPAFRALQTAYIQLLQNPFYQPENRSPRPELQEYPRCEQPQHGAGARDTGPHTDGPRPFR